LAGGVGGKLGGLGNVIWKGRSQDNLQVFDCKSKFAYVEFVEG
jgi:hypothetical protein